MSLLSILVRFIQMYKMLCVYNSDKKIIKSFQMCVGKSVYPTSLHSFTQFVVRSLSLQSLGLDSYFQILLIFIILLLCYRVTHGDVAIIFYNLYVTYVREKNMNGATTSKKGWIGWCAPQSQMHPSPSLIFSNYPFKIISFLFELKAVRLTAYL